MKRMLCLGLPNWPVQRLVAARPELSAAVRAGSHPVILLPRREPRRGEVVAACSAAAWARGVRVDMPLTEALALGRRDASAARGGRMAKGESGDTRSSPSSSAPVVVFAYDPAADQAALEALAQRCQRFSPLVGWETVAAEMAFSSSSTKAASAGAAMWVPAADHLFLDITGIGRLFGGEESLARELLGDCRAQGYSARVAIAPTLGAAWACVTSSPNSAPVAEVTMIPPGEVPAALGPRPVRALRLSADVVTLLAQLGVTRIEQLLDLPRDGLAGRFGAALLVRLDQALGAAPEWIRSTQPPPRFQAECCLEEPTDDRAALQRLLDQLLTELSQRLAARDEGVLQLTVRLDSAPGRPLELRIGLFRPTATARHLAQLVSLQLERCAWPGPVGRIGVQALLTAPLEHRQGLLFAEGGGPGDHAREVGDLLERLSGRLGMNAVLRPHAQREALPERAFGYEPAVGGTARRRGSGVAPRAASRRARRGSARRSPAAEELAELDSAERVAATQPLAMVSARPLEMHHPPEPLEVLAVAIDGPPVSFRWQRQPRRVARHWGPERIETGWWRGPSQRRDYYRVETTCGQRFWLFRDLISGQWFLHGIFL